MKRKGLVLAGWYTPVSNGIYSIFTHDIVAIGIGGALGANARYWLGKWIASHPWGQHFPLGTLIINVSGSFLLGVFIVLFVEKLPAPQKFWLLLLGTGFCGGYTTFSTFSFETFQLFEEGKWHFALINVLASVLLAFAAVALAFVLIRPTIPPQDRPDIPYPTPAGKAAGERADTQSDAD